MAVLDQVRPSTADARGATAKATPHRTVLLPIEGMTCASCVGRVERALKGVAGVSGVEVNLATERARVTTPAGAVSPADLVEAIGGAGYDAASVAAQAPAAADQTAKDKAARRDFTHILLERRGDAEEARRYRAVAQRFAGAWLDGAKDGGSTRLAFDRPGSWSLKYNLVWDRLLGFGLFPLEELRREQEDYRTKVKAYGVPLDGRGTVTKPEWMLWTATLADDRPLFEDFVERILRYVDETPNRVPFSDLYYADSGRKMGFQARSVVGGLFIGLLAEAWADEGAGMPNGYMTAHDASD